MTPRRLKELRKFAELIQKQPWHEWDAAGYVDEYIEMLDHIAELDAEIQRLRQQLADCERDKNILAAMSDPPRLDYGSA